MDSVRFGIYTIIGCIPWTAALACAGYAVGANWHSIANGFRVPCYIILAADVTVLAIACWRYASRRRAENASAGDHQPPGRAGKQQKVKAAGVSRNPT
jgi:membrane protein DedA with SNARE-associated domain